MLLVPGSAFAWGPQGHRVAGTLTYQYLDARTREQVQALLGEQTLARASTWADQMRSNPSRFWQEESKPWHYVTVPSGNRYADLEPPGKGDGVTALARFRATLLDPSASQAQKQLALRFSLHIIQDLHQPMHVGNGTDRGGNDVTLVLNGEKTNLHRVWDSAITAYAGLSDAAWVRKLSRLPQPIDAFSADPEVWIGESAVLRDRVYPRSQHVDDYYLGTHLPEVEVRLQLAAMRGAAYLNALWDSAASPPPD